MTIFIKEGRIALISGGKSNFVVIERHSLGGGGIVKIVKTGRREYFERNVESGEITVEK